jgi:nicotinate-nucleotide pyrophosphorylase (carboxylating)
MLNIVGINMVELEQFVRAALYEDVKDGDHTSLACIPADSRSRARLLVKDVGVLAGVDLAHYIFKVVDSTAVFEEKLKDGAHVTHGDVAFVVTCNTRALLMAERLVLNLMQRMSGVATSTDRFVAEIEHLPVKLLDTRKTTPLNRFIEKWGVRIGGGNNYRDGLYDRIMIKDNHTDASGGIRNAVERVHRYLKEKDLDLKITVEVRNLVELHDALDVGGIDRIMLDNFEPGLMREAVVTINNRCEVEASGGVNLHTIRAIAETGVHFISVGALTHSVESLDLSLKVIK